MSQYRSLRNALNQSDLLTQYRTITLDHINRVTSAFSGKETPWINARVEGIAFSPGEILDHLRVSQRDYLPQLLALAPPASSENNRKSKFGIVGKVLSKAAGPDGNAPVPSTMMPSTREHDTSILDEWLADQKTMLVLTEKWSTTDLASIRVTLPMIAMIKLNLCDVLLVFADHTERHVRQIETLAQR